MKKYRIPFLIVACFILISACLMLPYKQPLYLNYHETAYTFYPLLLALETQDVIKSIFTDSHASEPKLILQDWESITRGYNYYYPFGYFPGVFVFLFILFLIFGKSVFALKVFYILLHGFSAFLVFQIAASFQDNPREKNISGSIACLFTLAVPIFYINTIYTMFPEEIFSLLAFLLSIHFMIAPRERKMVSFSLQLGLFCLLCSLIKISTGLLFIMAAAGFLLLKNRRSIGKTIVQILIVCAVTATGIILTSLLFHIPNSIIDWLIFKHLKSDLSLAGSGFEIGAFFQFYSKNFSPLFLIDWISFDFFINNIVFGFFFFFTVLLGRKLQFEAKFLFGFFLFSLASWMLISPFFNPASTDFLYNLFPLFYIAFASSVTWLLQNRSRKIRVLISVSVIFFLAIGFRTVLTRVKIESSNLVNPYSVLKDIKTSLDDHDQVGEPAFIILSPGTKALKVDKKPLGFFIKNPKNWAFLDQRSARTYSSTENFDIPATLTWVGCTLKDFPFCLNRYIEYLFNCEYEAVVVLDFFSGPEKTPVRFNEIFARSHYDKKILKKRYFYRSNEGENVDLTVSVFLHEPGLFDPPFLTSELIYLAIDKEGRTPSLPEKKIWPPY